MSMHQYANDEITVYWDSSLCIHSGVCVRGLPNVFNPREKPWIDVDAASPEEIMNRIKHCPSGALSYKLSKMDRVAEESKTDGVVITTSENGPLMIQGRIKIVDKDGNLVKELDKAALCRCGQSSSKPFCDGTHRKSGFKA